MRNLTIVLLAAAIGLFALSSLAGAGDEEAAWFDMENCGFCKLMAAEEEMMMSAKWEHHNIANGVMSITSVPDEHLATYRKVSAKMEEVGMKMEKGEQVPMCNMCTAMGGLMMKGAKFEAVKFAQGDIWLTTSDNPEVVKAIQEWGEKTRTELAKMEGKEKEHGKKYAH